MWLSLLILPSAAAFSIYLLYRLDDSKLRRSLQLAILVSLAAHLLIMIVASMTSIFQNDFRQVRTKVAKRQPRTITVRQKNSNFVWEQPNMRETPEKEVVPEKTETTTETTPQTVPVPESTPTPQPQITKRKTTNQSIPRLDKQLSQRRRQTKQANPKLSAQAAASANPAPPQLQPPTSPLLGPLHPHLHPRKARTGFRNRPLDRRLKPNQPNQPIPLNPILAKQLTLGSRLARVEPPHNRPPRLSRRDEVRLESADAHRWFPVRNLNEQRRQLRQPNAQHKLAERSRPHHAPRLK